MDEIIDRTVGDDGVSREELAARIEGALPRLCAALLEERGQGLEIPEGGGDRWQLFRALVNTRAPVPATEEFLELQDALLRDVSAYRGVTRLEDIPAGGSDPVMRLWRGDITTLAVDAVVNAANSQMLGCFVPGHHCIDNAIHTFAGVELRLRCAELMDAQGRPEPTGRAKVTEAYNLPSRYVVHTVGPIVQGPLTGEGRELLSGCYTACLDAAAAAGCRSIAFCCISTGLFGFPQEEAAQIAVATVRDWLAAHDTPIDVVFNVFTEKDEGLYATLLRGE